MAHLLGPVIAVTETDETVVEGFQPAVGDGDTEDVAAEIVEDLSHHGRPAGSERPIFSSRLTGHTFAEQSLPFSDPHRILHGRSPTRRGPGRGSRVFGIDPGGAIGGKPSGSDEHMDMGMKEHGAGPGVENGQSADAGAEIAGIAGKFL